MKPLNYRLEGHTPVVEEDIHAWAKAFGDRFQGTTDTWSVDRTELPDGGLISTVFLGLDHSFGDGPPLLFESMYFPRKYEESLWQDEDCERCSTWKEAEAQHKLMVDKYTGE